MAKVYFISETYFKNNTPVNMNVEPQLINIAIMDAQVLHIQMALGSKLYKKLEDLISGNTIGDSSNAVYKTLLDDYVRPAVVQYALVECISYIRYKIMNKTVGTQNSDNTNPIEFDEMKYLQSQLRNKAEFYTQRIVDYIMANLSSYPEYTSTGSIDDIPPESNSYFGGMQLDDVDDAYERFLGLNSRTTDINI
jgi:hypothetical protein